MKSPNYCSRTAKTNIHSEYFEKTASVCMSLFYTAVFVDTIVPYLVHVSQRFVRNREINHLANPSLSP